jgi:hypothetical protein
MIIMAEKDVRDLHANQLSESELENTAGSGGTLHITHKVICGTCGYENHEVDDYYVAVAIKRTHESLYITV